MFCFRDEETFFWDPRVLENYANFLALARSSLLFGEALLASLVSFPSRHPRCDPLDLVVGVQSRIVGDTDSLKY